MAKQSRFHRLRGDLRLGPARLACLVGALLSLGMTAQAQRFNILPLTNQWRYSTACLDGTGWETRGYADGGWATGQGGFTGGETTASILDVCTTRTLPAPNTQGGRAQFFRTHFNVASTNGLSLVFSNAIDDAAVFYLNGVRVKELRVTANPALCSTLGGAAIGGSSEAQLWEVFTLTPAELGGIVTPGDNVLAVSVHQNQTGSSDMVFAMTLSGQTAFAPINIAPELPTDTNVFECHPFSLTARFDGAPAPSLQWYYYRSPTDAEIIDDATNATLVDSYTLTQDSHPYFCVASNASGQATSRVAQVTVARDVQPPALLWAIATNLNEIRLVFSEPICASAFCLDNLAWSLVMVRTNTGEEIYFRTPATWSSPTSVTVRQESFREEWLGYRLELAEGGISDDCPGDNWNTLTNLPVNSFRSTLVPFNAAWRFDDVTDTNTLDANWAQPGYDDSGAPWKSGPGPFDAKRDQPAPGGHCRTTALYGLGAVGTCLNLTSPVSGTNLVTANFRTQFTFAGNPARTILELTGKFDDGAVIYLNGVELDRIGLPAAPAIITRTNYATRTVQDTDAPDAREYLAPASLVNGLNVLAVELHQQSPGSTDLTMGLRLVALTDEFLPLTFDFPPQILAQPRNSTNVAGTTATFAVTAAGAPPLRYQWFFNATTPLADETNATLTLLNVQAGHAGNYSVVVTNFAGSVTSTVADLSLVAPPSIVSQPQPQDVPVGSTAAFGVSAAGTAPLRYQWFFNTTTPLADETNATLTLLNVQAGQGGNYSVVVTNLAGSVTSLVASLTALNLPVIVVPPINAAAANGDTVTFSVTATGSEPLAYRWFFNGTTPLGSTSNTLTLENIVSAQAGTYRVVVSNAVGSATSAVATLTVSTRHYVWPGSPTPTPPYLTWATAAHTIQDAVDAAAAGAEILVTNGVYATGGRVAAVSITSRVAVTKPVTVRSVNGPEVTLIHGYQLPGTTNGIGAIRCVYLTNGALLSGFTLTNGATVGTNGHPFDSDGGGVWCESASAVVSNCTLVGNSASSGGGAFQGTLLRCSLIGNTASFGGGGAYASVLRQCTLASNAAPSGGGAFQGTLFHSRVLRNTAGLGGGVWRGILHHTALIGNRALSEGGGTGYSTLFNCTVVSNTATDGGGGTFASMANNSIIYYNAASFGANYSESNLNFCCTTPLPPIGHGANNTNSPPLFENAASGNWRLQTGSPCVNAGNNALVSGTTDLDGRPRVAGGTVDIGAYEHQGPGMGEFIAWLEQHGLPSDGVADFTDPDGDRSNNWQEWQAHTDPTNALSFDLHITTHPQPLIAAAGNPANFAVSAVGTGPLAYQWLFNQTNALANATNATLNLANVRFDQAGGYSVLVTNLYGRETSSVALLTVTTPAGYFLMSNFSLAAGEMRLPFIGNAGARYALDRTFDLRSPTQWMPMVTNSAGPDGRLVFTNLPVTLTNNFWRIRAVPSP